MNLNIYAFVTNAKKFNRIKQYLWRFLFFLRILILLVLFGLHGNWLRVGLWSWFFIWGEEIDIIGFVTRFRRILLQSKFELSSLVLTNLDFLSPCFCSNNYNIWPRPLSDQQCSHILTQNRQPQWQGSEDCRQLEFSCHR